MATVKVTPEMAAKALEHTDWARIDALSDAQIEAAVAADPDAVPVMTDAQIDVAKAAMARTARARTGLSQAAFAQRYHIPTGTVRDWEQGRRAPDAAALAYLRVIEREPEMVAKTLEA